MFRRFSGLVLVSILAISGLSQEGSAQSFILDARRVALGGSGSNDNIASKVVAEHQPYRVIPIPLGVFQIVKNRKFFNPDDPEFDPARAIEFAANPLHFTLDRNVDSAGHEFVNNLVNAQFSSNLNVYRGFTPPPEIKAGGVFSPSWGKTFRVAGNETTSVSHGVYVGAGPYLTLGTQLNMDPTLLQLLASPTDVYRPNSTFLTTDVTSGQAAVAITGGYRIRFAVPGLSTPQARSGREPGIHVALNYNYLHGIAYESGDVFLRFDTDSSGRVIPPSNIPPLTVNRVMSRAGKGFALDIATALVTEKWDVSFGVDGIGNRINWRNLRGRQYVLQSLFNGFDFVAQPGPATGTTRRVELPIRIAGAGSYYSERWSTALEIGRDLQKRLSFNGGLEYRLGPLAVRGGIRHANDLWQPATGVGLNLTRKIGIDVAAFSNGGNIEEDRKPSFAVSLRIDQEPR